MQIEFGNAAEVETRGTGWFIGYSAWCRGESGLRHMNAEAESAGLCVKWYTHAPGDPNGEAKPISVGRSISMLIGATSEFRIEFAPTPGFDPAETVTHVLRRPGDFAAWGPGLYHRAFGVQQATILTLRWVPRDEP